MQDDDFLAQAQDDLQTVEYIKAYLPQEVKARFTDDDLYYFLDTIADYYTSSGLLEQDPDADGFIDIDTDEVAAAVAKQAHKDHYGDFDPEDIRWVVQAELEYGETAD